MMVDGQQKTLMRCCAKHARLSTMKTWKGMLKLQFKGRKKHMNEVSVNGKLELLDKNSKIIQRFHVVHPSRDFIYACSS